MPGKKKESVLRVLREIRDYLKGGSTEVRIPLPFSGTMAELRVAPGRLEKQADGWFKDRFLSAYYGKDRFWSPKSEEKHIDWKAGEDHGKALKGIQPDIFEFQSFKDYTKFNPCILDCAKVLEISTDDCYWTRETTAWNSGYAWFVYFSDGSVGYDGKGYSYYVRPCRSSK